MCSLKLPNNRDKQPKISSFFTKPKKVEIASTKNDIMNNVSKSNLAAHQLDFSKVGCLKTVSRNSESQVSESNEPERSLNKCSPLKEFSNMLKGEERVCCKNTPNNCNLQNQHNLSPHHSPQNDQKLKENNSTDSPDFLPPTPSAVDRKKTRKKGVKRKFCFSLIGSKEEQCIGTNIENQDSGTQVPNYNKSEFQDILETQNTECNSENNKLNSICKNPLTSENLDCKNQIVNKQCSFSVMETENNKQLVKSNIEIDEKAENKRERIKSTSCKQNLKTDVLSTGDINCQTPAIKNSYPINDSPFKKYKEEMSYDDSYLFENLDLDNFKQNNAISLESSVRCQVISLQSTTNAEELVLGLKTSDTCTATCVLCDAWAKCKLKVGDFVIVSAKPIEEQPGCWRVDNDFGSVVLHPDTLVSGTSLLSSLFCARRSVLSDGYRGLDSDSKIMIIGSLLHTLLQEVLKRNATSIEHIKEIVKQIMSTKQLLFTLYSTQMSLNETLSELEKFVPLIHNFIQQYIRQDDKLYAQPQKTFGSGGWKGVITGIADIEENIWAPRLGLKGKIDVTVHARINSRKKVMPLELKTGRASFSAEHQGQVILYTMMMTEMGESVDSGLLLYLREGMMKEIAVGNAERRDLTLLRNQFVYHLESSKQISYDLNECTIQVPNLPEPINHHSACSKCPYLTLCSAALKEKGLDQLSQSNPLTALSLISTQHLEKEHVQYVFHWSGLLRLEHAEAQKNGIKIQNIWTQTPQQREENGTCISNVILVGNVKEVTSGYYEHTFTWRDDQMCSVNEGEYLIVSSSKRVAVAAGTVRSVSDNAATLYLERDLSVRGESTWHLDRYESQTLLTFNLTNLGCLLDNTEEAKLIRESIISLNIPKFAPKLSSKVLKVGADLLSSLNSGQKSAVFQSLAAEQYILIKGMPGTGKTATVVSLVLLAVRLGQTVLITSHTHSAVDNVLLRLKGKVEFLRLGSSNRLHPDLLHYGEDNHACTTPEQLEAFYNNKPVVGVTCLGSGHPLLRRRKFDLCLVDEATQVLQPTVLRPLFSAKKFILVGDPDQLSPLVRSQEAKKMGLGVSLFERLDRPAVTTVLTLQYRMNETITKLANSLTYNGSLFCGNENIQNATLNLNMNMEDQPTWIKLALSPQMENSVVVLDTGDVASTSSNCSNPFEADAVIQLLNVLKKSGVSEKDVGVISPYRAQVSLLKQHTKMSSISIEVNTVDQYQGRDKDVIIYSCTRSSQAKECDILNDQKRMTVAITRARHKLIFIGNVQKLKSYSVFQKLFSFISGSNFISLPKSGPLLL